MPASCPQLLELTGNREHTWASQLSSKEKEKCPPLGTSPHPVLTVPSSAGPTWLVEVWSQLSGQTAGNVALLVGSQGGLFCSLSFGLGMACPRRQHDGNSASFQKTSPLSLLPNSQRDTLDGAFIHSGCNEYLLRPVAQYCAFPRPFPLLSGHTDRHFPASLAARHGQVTVLGNALWEGVMCALSRPGP